MTSVIRTICFGDEDYPRGLHDLKGNDRPASFTVEGDFSTGSPRVAIVGSRDAFGEVTRYLRRLAKMVVEAGGIVISGGALGADKAAHEGALEGRGRTWSVIAAGDALITPQENKELFAQILASGGAIIRTRKHGVTRTPHLMRNGVLVALADVVVAAQAAHGSGTSNSIKWAIDLGRPLWVIPGPPWLSASEFERSWEVILNGRAKLFRSEETFAREVLGQKRVRTPKDLTDDELHVLKALGTTPKHPDEIALETGLPTPAVTTALLTLALGDVVVEGSAGLFQRR